MILQNKIYKAIQKGLLEALDFSFDNDDVQDNKKHLNIDKLSAPYKNAAWINENFVDLDLPSGTLWCKYNLGADSEEQVGNYYAWAELEPKDEYTWDNYRIGKYEDRCAVLELSDDAAYQTDSRMCIPTNEQCEELIRETNHTWVNINGLEALKFESKKNVNNYIIVYFEHRSVCEGINNVGFWCNSIADLFVSKGQLADALQYDGSTHEVVCKPDYRIYGHHIRPVLKQDING